MTEGWHFPDPAAPVGVVALSGPADPRAVDQGLAWLRRTGREVFVASNATIGTAFLAGDDLARISGLTEVLDAGARVIVPVRGGYGVTRILDRLPWSRLADDGVTFVGYSDLTPILNHLALCGGGIQIHGPMVSDLARCGADGDRLEALMRGEVVGPSLFDFGPDQVLRPGIAEGRSMGGNLSLLAALAGTPYQPDLSDGIVFVEDVNEVPYRLDRLLTQIRSSGMFQGVKGLILGDLSGFSPAGDEAHEVLAATLLSCVSGPVVHSLPFGHGTMNQAFPVGARVRVDTDDGTIVWRV